MTDRPSPSSAETERSILGSILLDNSSLASIEDLSTEHFFLDSNKKIFRAILDMHEDGIPIDPFTVSETLRSRSELSAVGGTAYVASLTDGVPQRSNLSHYGHILAGLKQRRDLLMLAHNAIRLAHDQSEDMGKALEVVQQQAQKIVAEQAAKDRDIFLASNEFMKIGNRSVEWRVERVIEKGTNGIVQALPKTGKSLSVAHLAACLASGHPWFDLDVSRCRTALVSREDFAGTTARRLRRIFCGLGLNPDENIYGRNLWINSREQSKSLALDNPRELANLIKNLQKREIEFVILDVLNVLHSATDENDAAEMRAVMKKIELLKSETGAQICIVHHKKKGDTTGMTLSESGRGSSAISGFAEFIIDFRMVDEEAEIREARFETKAAGKYKPFFWKAIDQPDNSLTLERTQYENGGKRKAAKAV